MLYLGIDLHRKQLTVNVRNEEGDVVSRRQVSTQWKKVRKFFEQVRDCAASEGGFVAILEVCGFHDWLVKMLQEYGCREIVMIQPEKRARQKTDRRDANSLCELLWVNRERLIPLPMRGVTARHRPYLPDICLTHTSYWGIPWGISRRGGRHGASEREEGNGGSAQL